MKIKYIRRHKGIIPIPTGGSVKGTTLAFGDYGIRIKGNGMRISARQLVAAEDVLKRKLKTIKGVKVYMRVFPDIPVCVKVCLLLNVFCTPGDWFSRETKPVWVRAKARSNSGQRGTAVYHPSEDI